MKKRWWSVLLAASLISGALAGCGGSAGEGVKTSDPASASDVAASAEGTASGTGGASVDTNEDGTVNNPEAVKVPEGDLTFWSLFTGGDGEWWNSIVDQYNKSQNPSHPVTSITLVWADYYTKLQTAIATGNGPDLGVSHVSKLYELAETGAIEPLDDYLKELKINLADSYEKASIDAVTVDGHVYAIPLDTHAEVMYYNLDLLKKAGISEEDVKAVKSSKDFDALLKKCKDSLPEDVSPLALTNDSDDPFRVWYAGYFQAGGKDFVNEDGTKCTIDEKTAKDVMKWVKSLYDNGYVLSGIDDHAALFQSGKAVFIFGGTWLTGNFEKTEGLNFNNAIFPRLFDGGNQACWADSHTLILPVNKNRSEEETKECVKFLYYASDEGGLTWAGSGQIPSALKANQSAEYKKMKGYNVVDELKEAKYAPRTKTYYGGMKAEIIDALNGYWTGVSDLDTAYQGVKDAIENNLNEG